MRFRQSAPVSVREQVIEDTRHSSVWSSAQILEELDRNDPVHARDMIYVRDDHVTAERLGRWLADWEARQRRMPTFTDTMWLRWRDQWMPTAWALLELLKQMQVDS